MFALYLKSVGGKQTAVHAGDTLRAAELWTRILGPDYKIQRFGPSDWESFERLRGSGELDARGHTISDPDEREVVGPRVVAKDMKMLRAACRRATIDWIEILYLRQLVRSLLDTTKHAPQELPESLLGLLSVAMEDLELPSREQGQPNVADVHLIS